MKRSGTVAGYRFRCNWGNQISALDHSRARRPPSPVELGSKCGVAPSRFASSTPRYSSSSDQWRGFETISVYCIYLPIGTVARIGQPPSGIGVDCRLSMRAASTTRPRQNGKPLKPQKCQVSKARGSKRSGLGLGYQKPSQHLMHDDQQL